LRHRDGAFDEATAILAGDCLLTYAFEIAADPATHPDPALRAELVRIVARASGLGGMAGGQALDLEAERRETPLDLDETVEMQAMKTGALIAVSVEAGALMGGADAAQTRALATFGQAIGTAFQIADDLLDHRGDATTLGKRAGKDAARNKATLVARLGVAAAERRRDDLVDDAIAALNSVGAGERTGVLEAAARFVAGRSS
jgi:farnesyl diphosphate synthase